MPDLAMPVFNCEPITSLIGTMIFPNDSKKAGALASWHLAGALGAAPNEHVAEIDPDLIWAVDAAARGYPEIAAEAEKTAYRGTQAGYIGNFLWHAARTGVPATLNDAYRAAEITRAHATREDAIRAAAEDTARRRFPGVRSSFVAATKEFSRVLHFWAALSIAYGNRWPGGRDWQLFVSRAEVFLMELRQLETAGQTFRAPKFHLLKSNFDWPVLGKLRFGTVPDNLLPRSKKRAGRPPRIPVQR